MHLFFVALALQANPVLPAPKQFQTSTCEQWGEPKAIARLADPELIELSGLAASHVHPNLLYAHNDSGDVPRFFGLMDDGKPLGRYYLEGAKAVDWEDIAVGPCSEGSCIFLGDIGDNRLERSDYVVYSVREPDDPWTGDHRMLQFNRYPFQYPKKEKHNAETLLVHPLTGTIYVITKEFKGTPSTVYRFPMPLEADHVSTLEKVATLSLPGPNDLMLTGGDFDPTGLRLILRMYNRAVVLEAVHTRDAEDVFKATPKEVPTAEEPQGEAIAWGPDSHSYFTSSEKKGKEAPFLYKVECVK